MNSLNCQKRHVSKINLIDPRKTLESKRKEMRKKFKFWTGGASKRGDVKTSQFVKSKCVHLDYHVSNRFKNKPETIRIGRRLIQEKHWKVIMVRAENKV